MWMYCEARRVLGLVEAALTPILGQLHPLLGVHHFRYDNELPLF